MTKEELLAHIDSNNTALSLMYSTDERSRLRDNILRGSIRQLRDMYDFPKMCDAYEIDTKLGKLSDDEVEALKSLIGKKAILNSLPGIGGSLVGGAAGSLLGAALPVAAPAVPLLAMAGGLVGSMGAKSVPATGSLYDKILDIRKAKEDEAAAAAAAEVNPDGEKSILDRLGFGKDAECHPSDSYVAGFCKAAERIGVDPYAVASSMKRAYWLPITGALARGALGYTASAGDEDHSDRSGQRRALLAGVGK